MGSSNENLLAVGHDAVHEVVDAEYVK